MTHEATNHPARPASGRERSERPTDPNAPLSYAQNQILRIAGDCPNKRWRNNRIRRTVEVLERRGLVTYDCQPCTDGQSSKVWTINVTDRGREWIDQRWGAR